LGWIKGGRWHWHVWDDLAQACSRRRYKSACRGYSISRNCSETPTRRNEKSNTTIWGSVFTAKIATTLSSPAPDRPLQNDQFCRRRLSLSQSRGRYFAPFGGHLVGLLQIIVPVKDVMHFRTQQWLNVKIIKHAEVIIFQFAKIQETTKVFHTRKR